MIAILGALIAGVVIWKLWPQGVLFLVLWPALLVGVSLPTLSDTLSQLGYGAKVTPGMILLYYLQNAAITAVFFFLAFWIRNRMTRNSDDRDRIDNA